VICKHSSLIEETATWLVLSYKKKHAYYLRFRLLVNFTFLFRLLDPQTRNWVLISNPILLSKERTAANTETAIFFHTL